MYVGVIYWDKTTVAFRIRLSSRAAETGCLVASHASDISYPIVVNTCPPRSKQLNCRHDLTAYQTKDLPNRDRQGITQQRANSMCNINSRDDSKGHPRIQGLGLRV